MQDHNGIRPQDIVVLLKLILIQGQTFKLPTLAGQLGISPSEISKSIQRSQFSGLISESRDVAKQSFLDLIKYGIPYVFPVRPGAPARGIPTGISHPRISELFQSDTVFVWPNISGITRGLSINPLYPNLPVAVTSDEDLYFACALVELIRVGKTREKKYAEGELIKIFES